MVNIIGAIILFTVLALSLWLFLFSRGDGLAGRIIDWFGSKLDR
jgi:hypothetical protein